MFQRCLVTLTSLLSQIMAQPLEPISLCSSGSVPANRSGIIYHPGSPVSIVYCSVTLTGLNNGDEIILLGLRPRVTTGCVIDHLLRIDTGGKITYQCSALLRYKTIVTITGSELRLEVGKTEFEGIAEVEIFYYSGKWDLT